MCAVWNFQVLISFIFISVKSLEEVQELFDFLTLCSFFSFFSVLVGGMVLGGCG